MGEGAEPKVVQHKIFHVAAGLDKPTILGMLKSVEENSSHPLARAAVSFSLSEGVTAVEVSTIDEVAGKGLKATSQPAHSESQTQYEVLVGNEALLQDYSVAIPQDSVDLLESWKASGHSVMLLACRVSGEKWGLGAIFAASDTLLFVLVQSDLRAVLTLVTLSRAVFRRVILNFFWAALYNRVALPVAAGVLYPIQTGGGSRVRLDPAWAALAMALSSISVVASSLLLRTRIPGAGFRE